MNLRTFGLIFFIRKERAAKKFENLSPIYLRITVNGCRAEVAMQKYVNPENWDSSINRVRGNGTEARKINEFLDKEKGRVILLKDELLNRGEEITSEKLKEKYLGISEKKGTTFLKFFKKHNDDMKERINKDFSNTTWKRYETTYDHVKSYINKEFKKNDVLLNSIDHEFIVGLEHYLKTKDKPCDHNSTMKYLGNVRKITNLALNSDYIEKNPFRKFKIKYNKVKQEFLLWDDLKKIENLKIKIQRLDLVKDLFVFACYTALEFIDIEELNESHYQIESDGSKWIIKERSKTGITCYIPIFPETKLILEKYKDDPRKKDGQLLPVLSNQKLNAYLKEIADLAGINIEITTLTARRTFASVVGFKKGLTAESIRMVMGHSDLTMTSLYSQPDKTKIINDLKTNGHETI